LSEESRLRPAARPRNLWQRLIAQPQSVLVAGFGGAILVGAALLWLPFCHRGKLSPVDALFTATSAVCVTGLVVVDTGTKFTEAGQLVILVLIQAGGLGIMTFGALFFLLARRRLSIQAQAAVQDTFFQRDLAREFRTFLRTMLAITFFLEGAGAALLFFGFRARMSPGESFFAAVFHSVSAFCNAGFSTFSDNLEGWRGFPAVVWTTAVLIILGGLGHPVLVELKERISVFLKRKPPERLHMTLNTKIVTASSAFLIAGGAVFLFLIGTGPGGHQLDAALFQSITARTAGFNTVPIGALPLASLLVLAVLMFIGGSPGSCAGGIKTTTITVSLAWVWTRLRGRVDVGCSRRRIPDHLLIRAALLIAISLLWNLAGIIVLACAEPQLSFRALFFEQVSAFGTVGLSCGITSGLSVFSRLWIIATMFFGRLGPLTLVIWVLEREKVKIRYPLGHVMIG